jgi:dienelactone hydrolase
MRPRRLAAMAAALLTLLPAWEASAAQPAWLRTPVVGDPGPDGRRIDEHGVFGNFFAAKAPGRRPAILLIGGSEGGLQPGSGGIIGGLVGVGFDVLYVCYFGCPGTPPQMASVPLETFDRALAWLETQPGIDARRIGVVGGSKGAEAALLVAARRPQLRAVVVAMPSSVAWPAITATGAPAPSWTLSGAPVAFLPYAIASFAKRGIFGLYNDALPTERQHPDAVIPVERITAPLLLVCGEADNLWPSCKMADEIAARRAAHHKPPPTILRYPDAGHGVFGPPPPTAVPTLAQLGGTPEGNLAARADAWPKVLAFLAARLRP